MVGTIKAGKATTGKVIVNQYHLEGVTRLCYSKDGQVIYTAGTDSMVRIHTVGEIETGEPEFLDDHPEAVTCCVATDHSVVTGSIDGIVRRFDYPSNQLSGNITRAAGVPIHWLSVDNSGARVAVCSEELLVKVVDIQDPMQILTISGISKPVRSASWHPVQDMLTLVMTDGRIQVYEFVDDSPSCLKTVEGLAGAGKLEDELPCVVAWHPKGDYFVVPSRTHEIAIVDRDKWAKSGTFSTDGHDAEIGLLAWSPNGKYLASSARDDQLIIWNAETRKPVARMKTDGNIVSGLEFSPTDNTLSFTTTGGNVYVWQDVIPSGLPHPAKAPRGANGLDMLAEDDDMDGDDDLDNLILDDDAWIEHDEDEDVGHDGKTNYRVRGESVDGEVEMKEMVGVEKAQSAFQPGSTSFQNKRRYLAFNMIGVIDVTDMETHQVINVEFHDKGSRRGYHFQDNNRFHLAAVGEQGIIYASNPEGGERSMIEYRAYDGDAKTAAWQASLEEKETAILVAAGGSRIDPDDVDLNDTGGVAIATSKGYVRFFTGTGLQRYIWRLGDEVVAMVASREMIFVIHREGGTSLDGCQNLRYTLMDLEHYDIVQEGRMPLPKRTSLTWIGFTTYGSPVMYDSHGLLSVLDRARRPGQGRWMPLLDTTAFSRRKEGRSERYWPVGVSEDKLMCIILKGTDVAPGHPRPIILDIDIEMPLLNKDQAQGRNEELIVRSNVELEAMKDNQKSAAYHSTSGDIARKTKEQDKILLTLLMEAVKADRKQQAFDIVRMLHNAVSMNAASQIAELYSSFALKERILLYKADFEAKHRAREKAGRSDTSLRHLPDTYDEPYSNDDHRGSKTSFEPRKGVSRRTAAATVTKPAARYESPLPVADIPSYTDFDSTLDSSAINASPSRKRKMDDDFLTFDEPSVDRTSLKKAHHDETVTEVAHPAKAASKNPFARGKPVASNPFARPANGKVAQATTKSKSFFERVDDIQAKGKVNANAAKGKQHKQPSKDKTTTKQATLFSLKGAPSNEAVIDRSKPPAPETAHEEVLGNKQSEVLDLEAEDLQEEQLQSEEDLEETQIEETQIDETPQPVTEEPEPMEDDEEPLEWEESDAEEA
ncbi:hypothetical protein QFC22_003083 [Naganishia vaughanmartiniae]|uniref:Uncharacterized protein n=1 Tax=Naganishia vaughanmartiniae TaxID=1424756 RepID=A0ACC2X9U4_9TREE|nr:hypothetical protein QFC22_003083 [Naganishia vaughanmartiniae]